MDLTTNRQLTESDPDISGQFVIRKEFSRLEARQDSRLDKMLQLTGRQKTKMQDSATGLDKEKREFEIATLKAEIGKLKQEKERQRNLLLSLSLEHEDKEALRKEGMVMTTKIESVKEQHKMLQQEKEKLIAETASLKTRLEQVTSTDEIPVIRVQLEKTQKRMNHLEEELKKAASEESKVRSKHEEKLNALDNHFRRLFSNQVHQNLTEERTNIHSPSCSVYDEEILIRIRTVFVQHIHPLNVLYLFHKYNTRILTQYDMEKVTAVTKCQGKFVGAAELLSCLVRCKNWFPCLLQVLRDPLVKQERVANRMEEILEQNPVVDADRHNVMDEDNEEEHHGTAHRNLTEERTDIHSPFCSVYDEEILKKIRTVFVQHIIPLNVLHMFHHYNTRILTPHDIEKVTAVTKSNGNFVGAAELLSCLIRYKDWFPCLLQVLRDPNVKQDYVANGMEEILRQVDADRNNVMDQDNVEEHHDHGTESQEISKLHRHMEVLEIALTTCRNEISKANTDKNEVRDKLDKLENHIRKVETSQSHEFDQYEKRLSSLEKLTQQTQSNMTKEIKDLQKTFKDKIRKTKLELDTKVDSVDKEILKIQKQNMTNIKEQASKLSKVERKLKKMKEEEQERWSQIDSIHKDVESLKDDQRDNQQLVKLVKIQGLEKHMETLTSQCDSLQDQVGKIEPVMQMSQELAHKISSLATDEQVQELIQTTTATSRSLEELLTRVGDTERSVRGCVAQRERDENRRREIEDRVAVLEAQRQKDLDHYTKELEETNSLYKAVCQLVDQRVTPLRRLQRMLNDYHKQVEKREEISTRLDDVIKKVEDISTQLDKYERSVVPARVGFTAYCIAGGRIVPSKGSRIRDFTDVLCNEGNHYKASTGEFICPTDGLYLVSTTLWQFGDGAVQVHTKCQFGSMAAPPRVVCKAATHLAKTSCCGVAVTRLQKGDRLFVEVVVKLHDPGFDSYSSFSCFQIC